MDASMNELEQVYGTWPDFDIPDDRRTVGEDEIRNRFGFHKGTIEGPNATSPQHAYLRVQYMWFVDMLDRLLPPSRAKSVAMTEMETASMWAHKAIAEQAPVSKEGFAPDPLKEQMSRGEV